MENKAEIFKKLAANVGEENVVLYADMADYCTFRAGGKTDILVTPTNISELQEVLRLLSSFEAEYTVVGRCSNILVRDEGYHGVIVKLGEKFAKIYADDEDGLYVFAGALMPAVARVALEQGLSGLEFASGIPGSMGGAVYMNAGAYDSEMKDCVTEVAAVSKDGKVLRTIQGEDLGFGYRKSAFADNGFIAAVARLQLKKGNKEEIEAKMKDYSARRAEKQPLSLPSAGSFFKRPEGYFAGKLIQDAGLKGLSVGGAQVSPLHAGFIVNVGDATAQDILDLGRLVTDTVYSKFGVKLEMEVKVL